VRKIPEYDRISSSGAYEPGTIIPWIRESAIACAKKYKCRVYIRENTRLMSQWIVENFDTHLHHTRTDLRTVGYADPNCFVRLVRTRERIEGAGA
jgi:hypothetical protein